MATSKPGFAISNFAYVPLNEYLQIQNIEHGSERHKSILHYLDLRGQEVPCDVCGNIPIWVTGSAACDWPGCFTCITGESDASDDYEV